MNQLIYNAVLSNNKQQQEQAERSITELRAQNPAAFLWECVVIVLNQAENQVIRQSAATVLSRSVGLKLPQGTVQQQNAPLWDYLPPGRKEQVKGHLISMLVNPSDKIRRAACNAIASVAAIEILRGEWLGLIDTLNQNTQNSDSVVRKTSCSVLGFICQQLKQSNRDVSIQVQNSLLTGILSGITHSCDNGIMLVALVALRDALPFLGQLVANKNVSDYIVKELISNIKSECDDIKQAAIQAVIEFCKVIFDSLDRYVQVLYEVSEPFLNSLNSQTILVLELWDDIGQEYLERVTRVKRIVNAQPPANHLLQVHEKLVQQILSLLILVINASEDELQDSAIRTMSTIADCCGNIVFPLVTTFVSNCILSSEWKHRQASVIAFSTLSESSDRSTVSELFSKAIVSFMNLLQDQNKQVVENSLLGLCRILEFHYKVLLQDPNYEAYIYKFTTLSTGTDRIAELALLALRTTTDYLSSVECPLRQNILPLLNMVSGYAFASQKVVTVSNYFKIVLNLMSSCDSPEVACRYLEYLILKFQQITLRNQLSNTLKWGILSAIFTCLLALRNCALNEQILSSLLDMVIQHFQSFKDVDAEGIYVISGLSMVYQKVFTKVLDRVWPYILHGLAKTQEPPVLTASLNCVSDIARSIDTNFLSKFRQVMDILLKAVGSDVSRQLKLVLFRCISDCLVAVGSTNSEPYLKHVLGMVDLGLQGAIALSNNPDELDYAESLKEATMDLYQCINYAMTHKTSLINPTLQAHFSNVIPLIIETCARRFNPTIEYLATCVQTLSDTGYHLHMLSRINTSEMRQLVDLLRAHQKNNHRVREIVEYADRMILASI